MRGKVVEFLDSNLRWNFVIEDSLKEEQKLRVLEGEKYLNKEVEYETKYIPGHRHYGDLGDMKGFMAVVRS